MKREPREDSFMAYQVIARKWRPQTFEEVTGQEPITRTLRGAIEHDRLHHAYLFSGARGVGKTTTARLLAKAVNCHRFDRPTPTPCAFTDPDACASCREIAEGRSIDVLEIDAASNTGVDNVRDAIINTVGVRPARDRYKVFIIDEVHMLSGAAFNALLKTLEEPPPRVLFIMATTESHKVPDTILSRCQQFEFRTIAATKIAERLRLIADAEKIEVSEDALREIARAGEGSMRDAQSAFDQVISFSEGSIGTEDVETALGIASAELRARVMRSVADTAPSEALAVVDDLVMRGHDLRNFCRDLLAHLRDLLVVKVLGEGGAGSMDASEQERRALLEESAAFSESDLVRFFHSLTETEKHLRESAHPRYQLEIGLVKLIEMRRLAPLAAIVERLNALEESLRDGRAPAKGGGTSTPPTPAPGGSSNAPHRGSGSRRGSAKGLSGTDASASDTFEASREARVENMAASSPASELHDAAPQSPVPPSKETATRSKETATPAARQFAPPRIPSFVTPPAGLKLVPTPATEARDSSGAPFTLSNDTAPSPTPDDAAPLPLSNHNNGIFTYHSNPSAVPAEPSFFDAPANGDSGEQKMQTGVYGNTGGASPAAVVAELKDDDISRIKRALDDRRKPFLAIALEGARRVSIEGAELYVEFAPEGKHLREMLSKPDNVRIVRETCCEVMGHEMGVRIVSKEAGASEDVPLSQQDEERFEKQRLRQWAEEQPVVQQLLKTFRGEIIDVRRLDGEPSPPPQPANK